jgi:hypothetical protein
MKYLKYGQIYTSHLALFLCIPTFKEGTNIKKLPRNISANSIRHGKEVASFS